MGSVPIQALFLVSINWSQRTSRMPTYLVWYLVLQSKGSVLVLLVETPRSASFHYRVKTTRGEIVVCKNAFASIFGVSISRIRHLCEWMSSGEQRHLLIKEVRMKIIIHKQVCDHIESFPPHESHYSTTEIKCIFPKGLTSQKCIIYIFLMLSLSEILTWTGRKDWSWCHERMLLHVRLV